MSERPYRTYEKSGVTIAEPTRPLSTKEWGRFFDELNERQIPGLSCGPETEDREIAIRFTDRQLKQVCRLDHLRSLSLGGCGQISDKGLGYLSGLPRLEYLDLDLNRGHNRLDLVPARITDDGLAVLRDLPHLAEVHLWSLFQITDRAIAHLGDHRKLRRVSMQRTMAGDGAIETLTGNPDMVGLSPGTQITNAGLRHVLFFPRFRKWRQRRCYLSLMQSPRISDAGVETISQLYGLYALVLPEGAHFNNWIKRMPEKVINTIRYTEKGVRSLQRLSHLRKLWLTLKTDGMMEAVARIPNLQVVEGGAHRLSGTGFAALADSSVESLGGWFCTDLTAEGLSVLTSLPHLTFLHFDELETQGRERGNGDLLYRYRFSARFRAKRRRTSLARP